MIIILNYYNKNCKYYLNYYKNQIYIQEIIIKVYKICFIKESKRCKG